jgi:hypothetical protein
MSAGPFDVRRVMVMPDEKDILTTLEASNSSHESMPANQDFRRGW